MAYDLVVIADPESVSMASSTSQGRRRWLEATRLVAGSRGDGDQADATGGR
jgi:hypothetical protein